MYCNTILAESSLIYVISIWLSILFCIDNLHFFHTLFFVSHIFSTNPVPLHFFIIVCSSGGLQVGWTIQRIIVRWFVVTVACRFVFYSQNNLNLLLTCLSTYGNYNLQAIFLQEKILWY